MNKPMLQFAFLFIAATLGVTFAQAQSGITVKVPFEFSISNKTFAAGEYAVSSSRGLFILDDSRGRAVFIGFADPISGRRVSATGQVVFHCYDERCFLSEFWPPNQEEGRVLRASHYEQAFAKRKKATEFALLEQPRKER